MSEIALYDTLRKIPEVSDAEAKEAVADIASVKEMATKADIKDMATKVDIVKIEKIIAELEAKLTRQMYAAVGIILAGVGLMIKFL